MASDKRVVVVPEAAERRGAIIIGDLACAEGSVSAIVAHFSNLSPYERRGKIYFYPDADQAKYLETLLGPFSFSGRLIPQDGIEEQYTATGLWLDGLSRITCRGMQCYTQCSSGLFSLRAKGHLERMSRPTLPATAWAVVDRCFLLQTLATSQDEQIRRGKEIEPGRGYRLNLSDGATAEVYRVISRNTPGGDRDIREMGYAIHVTGVVDEDTVKRDIDGLLVLASLASRQQTRRWYCRTQISHHEYSQQWQFWNVAPAKRVRGIEPLIPRVPEHCSNFLSAALDRYLSSRDRELLDAAVYALLASDLPLETRVVRLFSGVQSALLFAVPQTMSPQRRLIRDLFEEFDALHSLNLSDLWPLFGERADSPLIEIRNHLVHGKTVSAGDASALSYAAENLQWILERIVLTALGWDANLSDVSPASLRRYTGYRWTEQKAALHL